ncbi:unnamed protein product [Acanthoscelides obtectus]|uniref:Ion transport domain-containing protein n=1 Tax=Acanthoscelides obtectus TaxID=200917 RepID=A0A9P0KKV1_ACAOB|nr:unnamed protein product [Acanthoscelides obtectus]CAK1656500.1 Sodium channel protein 60E [Acanthoscelides obtectus]
MDYEGWLQFQQGLYQIVKDPLFELAITVCIVLNTMFLAMEHHGMSENVLRALDIGNKVFTSIFTFECCLKIMALSKDFFYCGWNIFDLIIVSASLLDLIFELVDGLSVLRGLRLLRVLKLAQSWITMKVLLSIIISTIGALGNLTFVLVIVIYIFAVIGMQLFSKDYTEAKFHPDPVPRWNFTDFFHSFMMIFRILCGEWIEPLWDCMRAEKTEGPGTCLAVFLPTLVMGNFMVLNLFLALLLNSFNSEELKTRKEEVGDESKLAQSFERIRDLIRKRKMEKENENNSRLEQIVREVMARHAEEEALKAEQQKVMGFPRDKRSYQEAMNRPISIISYDPPEYQERIPENKSERNYQILYNTSQDVNVSEKKKVDSKLLHNMSSGIETTNSSKDDATEGMQKQDPADNKSEKTTTDCDTKSENKNKSSVNEKPWATLVSYVDELTVGGRRNSKGQFIDGMGDFPGFGKKKKNRDAPPCFPLNFYESNDSVRPNRLERHLKQQHPSLVLKTKGVFSSKAESLKRMRLDKSGSYHTGVSQHLKASFEIAFMIAKAKETSYYR